MLNVPSQGKGRELLYEKKEESVGGKGLWGPANYGGCIQSVPKVFDGKGGISRVEPGEKGAWGGEHKPVEGSGLIQGICGDCLEIRPWNGGESC